MAQQRLHCNDATLHERASLLNLMIQLLERAGRRGIPQKNLRTLLVQTLTQQKNYDYVVSVLLEQDHLCVLHFNGERYTLTETFYACRAAFYNRD